MAGIVRARRLPEKLFVIHQFTDGMIQGKDQVLPRPGPGRDVQRRRLRRPARTSSRSTRAFTAQTRGRPFDDGYKLFYHEDTNLMSPADVMAMTPRPDLVVYE